MYIVEDGKNKGLNPNKKYKNKYTTEEGVVKGVRKEKQKKIKGRKKSKISQ